MEGDETRILELEVKLGEWRQAYEKLQDAHQAAIKAHISDRETFYAERLLLVEKHQRDTRNHADHMARLDRIGAALTVNET